MLIYWVEASLIICVNRSPSACEAPREPYNRYLHRPPEDYQQNCLPISRTLPSRYESNMTDLMTRHRMQSTCQSAEYRSVMLRIFSLPCRNNDTANSKSPRSSSEPEVARVQDENERNESVCVCRAEEYSAQMVKLGDNLSWC